MEEVVLQRGRTAFSYRREGKRRQGEIVACRFCNRKLNESHLCLFFFNEELEVKSSSEHEVEA